MNLFTNLLITKTDNEGVSFSISITPKSFVKQFLQLLYIIMSQDLRGTDNILQTNGSAGTETSTDSGLLDLTALGASKSKGINVGTGIGATTLTTFALVAPITNGSSAGKLLFQSSNFYLPVVVGNKCSFIVSRDFLNSSPAPIVVTEIGMSSGVDSTHLIERTVVSPITILVGETLTVNYEIGITV